MSYYAIIKLEDQDSPDVHKIKGEASKALLEAIEYIKQKDGNHGFLKNIAIYIRDDFDEFERFLREPIRKKDG